MSGGGCGTLEGLQRNRAQLVFNWVSPPTTQRVHVCTQTHTLLVLLSNFPADGSEELNASVWQQPSYETLHTGCVWVVWLIKPSTNQGLWQLRAPMNLSAAVSTRAQTACRPPYLGVWSQPGGPVTHGILTFSFSEFYGELWDMTQHNTSL